MLITRARNHVHVARTAAHIDVGEAAALTETFAELCGLVDDDVAAALPGSDAAFALLVPRSLVWSAVFMLLDAYSCPASVRDLGGAGVAGHAKTAEELAMQAQSVDGLSKVSQRVRQFTIALRHETEIGRVSPPADRQPVLRHGRLPLAVAPRAATSRSSAASTTPAAPSPTWACGGGPPASTLTTSATTT